MSEVVRRKYTLLVKNSKITTTHYSCYSPNSPCSEIIYIQCIISSKIVHMNYYDY